MISGVDTSTNINDQIEALKHRKENRQRDMNVLRPKVRNNPENLVKWLELNDDLRKTSITLAELIHIRNML